MSIINFPCKISRDRTQTASGAHLSGQKMGINTTGGFSRVMIERRENMFLLMFSLIIGFNMVTLFVCDLMVKSSQRWRRSKTHFLNYVRLIQKMWAYPFMKLNKNVGINKTIGTELSWQWHMMILKCAQWLLANPIALPLFLCCSSDLPCLHSRTYRHTHTHTIRHTHTHTLPVVFHHDYNIVWGWRP